MPEEKKPEDEVVWRNIDELLAEADAVHFSKAKFRGKIIKIGWKELSEEETAAKTVVLDPDFKNKPRKEQDAVVQAWIEEDILAKIAKAGKLDGCFHDNLVTKEIWGKLPQRVRMALITDVLETKDELMQSFF